MSTLGYILLFTFFGSFLSLISVALVLRSESWLKRTSSYFSSFAAGVLLFIAFLDLLPEALEEAEISGIDPRAMFIYALLGFLVLFVIERVFHWHHHHEGVHHDDEARPPAYRYLIMAGDILHNFLDGMAIGATFLVSVPLGITTAISIFFHEIPKEIGDISLLIRSGLKRKSAIIFNLATKTTSFLGAIIAFLFAGQLFSLGPLFAFAAGSFLYITAVDLIPEIHEEKNTRRIVTRVFFMFLGIALLWIIGQIMPHE